MTTGNTNWQTAFLDQGKANWYKTATNANSEPEKDGPIKATSVEMINQVKEVVPADTITKEN